MVRTPPGSNEDRGWRGGAMRFFGLLILLGTFLACAEAVQAQMPTYNLGRAPTKEEVQGMDTIISPTGKGLPPGKGTARDGEPLFAKKCVACHGRNGEGTKVASQIIGDVALENYPFATSIWSFIFNAMPRNQAVVGLRQGTLSPDEVYALTAFILYKNNVIKDDYVIDAQSLPMIRMPSRDPHLDRLAPPSDHMKH
jgi:mono/diheme cytochrome c family protein